MGIDKSAQALFFLNQETQHLSGDSQTATTKQQQQATRRDWIMTFNKTSAGNTLARSLALLATAAVFLAPLSALAQKSAEKPKADQKDHSQPAPEARPTEINWVNYEDGLALAQELEMLVLIDFSTAWCGYCKKMDRETFKNTRVIDFINDNFIAIKVDGDSRREFEIDGFVTTERRITKEMYGVRGFPTFWFLESDGTKIGRQPGYQPAAGFLTLLEYVSNRDYEENEENAAR